MNTERILAVADAIERQALLGKVGFNMDFWVLDVDGRTGPEFEDRREANPDVSCGTVACIAGWATILEDGLEGARDADAFERGRQLFDLDHDTADALFIPYASEMDFAEIPAELAVAVLRNLAKTGEVDWTIDYEPFPEPVKLAVPEAPELLLKMQALVKANEDPLF